VRSGIRVALDPGTARVGVALSDLAGQLAVPHATWTRGDDTAREVASLVCEVGAIEVLIGLPRRLAGDEGPAAAHARSFAHQIAEAVPVPVRLVDERLTTVLAQSQLQASGRSTRRQRAVIDQAAAVVLLQSALDTERTTGQPPGELVD